MHRRQFILVAALLAGCSRSNESSTPAVPASSSPPDDSAAATIRPIYDRYLNSGQTFPSLEDMAPWTDDMRMRLTAMNARSEEAHEPILDFDPFIGAQDWEISNFMLRTDELVKENRAVVRASFTNVNRPTEIFFDLTWSNGQWRLENIRGADWNLRHIVDGQ